jgi:hypothetical protein
MELVEGAVSFVDTRNNKRDGKERVLKMKRPLLVLPGEIATAIMAELNRRPVKLSNPQRAQAQAQIELSNRCNASCRTTKFNFASFVGHCRFGAYC